MAKYFLAHGFNVAGCSRGNATIEDENYFHSLVDIGEEGQTRSWVRAVKNRFKRVDVLVCNAGHAPANLLMTMTSGTVLMDLLKVNLAGSYYVCREVSKVMLLQRSGRIITTSSMAVGLHEEGTSAYSASKSAIVEMTKIMAKELAPAGITCNVIAPSILMTDAVDALGDEIVQRVLNKLTIRRAVTVEEVCNIVSFFSAPESRCITGQVIHMGLVC
ncbi:MAG: SDR family oxidoreductase [Desulfuromonadaceae bacterium]|nr:SDR family oxidoreductase [Desulfuromonadaceae bacterium]